MRIETLIVDDEPLARERVRSLLAQMDDIAVVGECGAGREAARAIMEKRPDLVFLDVQMPELDGFGVLRKIPAEAMPVVIFVTAYDEYAIKAFDVQALDYLLKPFDRQRFARAVERARAALSQAGGHGADARLLELLKQMDRDSRYERRLAIKSAGRISFVSVDEIEWLEAADNYVRLHTGATVHLLRATMSSLEERLDATQFIRIHRSTIVRSDRIKEIQPLFNGEYAILLRDGRKLTCSRGYRYRIHALIDGTTEQVEHGPADRHRKDPH